MGSRKNNKNCGGGKSRLRRRLEKIKIVEKEGIQGGGGK